MAQTFLFIVYLVSLFGFSFVLIKSTDILIVSLKRLSTITKLGKYAATSIILGLATSLPEIFVGIVSALENRPSLSLGNVIGSNIADLSIVIGGAALLASSVKVQKNIINKDLIIAFAISALPVLFLFNKTLSQTEGFILILTYFFYNFFIIKNRHKKTNQQVKIVEQNYTLRIFNRFFPKSKSTQKLYRDLFLGIILLLFSADMIVKVSTKIAIGFNIPILFIGMFLVAIGTSLPELTFEIRTLKAGQSSMAIGNILGSIVVNSTLVLGLTSVLKPIVITNVSDYLLPFIFTIIIFSLFYLFIKSKQTLNRWEGLALIIIYVYFIILELLKRT